MKQSNGKFFHMTKATVYAVGLWENLSLYNRSRTGGTSEELKKRMPVRTSLK